mmetsp:Transcript_22965/g.53245  ORF Transcript_22965/g.53245 Transcript_22965/m.53245 type:complete len:146 (-) Transcript_22965:270-707(-)
MHSTCCATVNTIQRLHLTSQNKRKRTWSDVTGLGVKSTPGWFGALTQCLCQHTAAIPVVAAASVEKNTQGRREKGRRTRHLLPTFLFWLTQFSLLSVVFKYASFPMFEDVIHNVHYGLPEVSMPLSYVLSLRQQNIIVSSRLYST